MLLQFQSWQCILLQQLPFLQQFVGVFGTSDLLGNLNIPAHNHHQACNEGLL